MRAPMKLLCLVAAVLGAGASFAQNSEIEIVTELPAGRVPIVVPPVAVSEPELSGIAREMAEAVAFDLEFTGLFTVLPESKYPAGFTGLSTDVTGLKLEEWRGTEAENLVYGNIRIEGGRDLMLQSIEIEDEGPGR